MLSEKIQNLADENNGVLPSCAWPGGYPLFYVDDVNLVLCPDCANKHEEYSGVVVATDANWEDPSMYCDNCSKRIPSAYAEDE